MNKLALLLLALSVVRPSAAVAEMPVDLLEDTIIQGQKVPETSRFFKTTVMLVMVTQKDGQSGVGLCSGTLIAKILCYQLLTA